MVAPLAIVQARVGSKRLPGKVLLTLGGKTIIEHVWRRACEAFGEANVVVAYPDTAENAALSAELYDLGAQKEACPGPEDDVLGRFWYVAHRYRWHPDCVIVRVCADDPFHDPHAMKRVANGERLPVPVGAEAFTLAMLDAAILREPIWVPDGFGEVEYNERREHITRALFEVPPPAPPPGIWSVDTEADYQAMLGLFK